jgi:hypothetical protein
LRTRAPLGGVGGLDLEVLGGVGVDHVEALVEVVDEHDAGLLATERGGIRSGAWSRHLLVQLGVDRVGERLARGDQHRRGERVVLGLADQVGGDVRGSAVSSARIAISVGPASESMPTWPLSSRLAATDVDVAGTGDQVDPRLALAGAVGEHRDRLGAADGVDLVDAEQRARRQDRRVRQARRSPSAAGWSARSSSTPATCAGTTFISTLETSGARPPGT